MQAVIFIIACFFKLKNIVIPNSVTIIGTHAFYLCESIESIVIPNGVTEIETHAFSCCDSLVSITIQKNIQTIHPRVFAECTKISDIYFEGTIEEWNSINKQEDWDRSYLFHEWSLCVTIHCSDGQIIHSAK